VIRPNALLDEFVIMPNHIHAILALTGGVAGERRTVPGWYTMSPDPKHAPVPDSIAAIMLHFRSNCTRRINSIRETPNQPVWQENYYEHTITNALTLERIRDYISGNSSTWDRDENNPAVIRRSGNPPRQ
jgi:putative transposase